MDGNLNKFRGLCIAASVTVFTMKAFLIILAIVAIVLIVRFLLRQRRLASPPR